MSRIEHDAVWAPAQDTCQGMVRVHTCVSVHCDQCGDALGDPGFEAHYPTEDAALDAAAAEGVDPRLECVFHTIREGSHDELA